MKIVAESRFFDRCPSTSIKTTKCFAVGSHKSLRIFCHEKNPCNLSASNSVFGDPCVGTYKYIRFFYRCRKTIGELVFSLYNSKSPRFLDFTYIFHVFVDFISELRDKVFNKHQLGITVKSHRGLVQLQVGSVVEWLKHRTDDQHGLGSKLTCTILLCPWKRHFTAFSPACWSWKTVLNYSNISTKLLADSNILVSPEAGRSNCLPYVLAPPSLSCESGG